MRNIKDEHDKSDKCLSLAMESVTKKRLNKIEINKGMETYVHTLTKLCDRSQKAVTSLLSISIDLFDLYIKTLDNNMIKMNNEIITQTTALNHQLNSIGKHDPRFSDLKTEHDNLLIKFKLNEEVRTDITNNTFKVSEAFKGEYNKLKLISYTELSKLLKSFDRVCNNLTNKKPNAVKEIPMEIEKLEAIMKNLDTIHVSNALIHDEILSIKNTEADKYESITVNVLNDMRHFNQLYKNLHKNIIDLLTSYKKYVVSDANNGIYKYLISYVALFLAVGKIISQQCYILMKIV